MPRSVSIASATDEQFDDFIDELVRVAEAMWQYRTDRAIDEDRLTTLGEALDEFFTEELGEAGTRDGTDE